MVQKAWMTRIMGIGEWAGDWANNYGGEKRED
jgi:hypothetical protein